MKVIPEDKLIWSAVVANSKMNRQRNASGSNSYEQEFKFRPELFLEEKIREYGQCAWLDLCCGEGTALWQAETYFSEKGLGDKITLKGVDLVGSISKAEIKKRNVKVIVASVVDYVPDSKYDLVTCVHGIHYLGNKLKVIETAIASLKKDGLFIANADLDNIHITNQETRRFLTGFFKQSGILYNSRTKILQRTGYAEIRFDLKYLGADDKAGPNYTGQDAVTSYYESA